jgi:hypothetical protein
MTTAANDAQGKLRALTDEYTKLQQGKDEMLKIPSMFITLGTY